MPLSGLNPQQYDAATELERHCSVLSIPGSGKTKMVISKIAHIFQTCHNRTRVGAVTFTKKAAEEMRSRVGESVPENIIKSRLLVKTFNAMGMYQLNSVSTRGRKKTRYRIAENWELKSIAARGIQELGIDLSTDDFLSIAGNVKSTVDRSKIENKTQISIYEFYQDSLKEKGAIDFTDQILLAVEGMENGTIAPPDFDYLMVDEFQDADELQLKWLDLIIKLRNPVVTVVGDDDQAIYAFRGSQGYKGVAHFEKTHNARRIVLDTNYRSHAEILHHSAKLIERNPNRVSKDFKSFRGPGGSASWKHLTNEEEQVEQYVAIIEDAYKRTGKYSSVAIIARTNEELIACEMELTLRNIPSYIHGGGSFADSFAFRVFISLLKSVASKLEDGVLHTLSMEGMRDDDIARLRALNDGNLLNIIRKKEISVPDSFSKDAIRTLEDTVDLFVQWRELLEEDNNISLVVMSVEEYLIRSADCNKNALSAVARLINRQKGTLSERIRRAQELLEKDDQTDNAVHLITSHSSKGLEFPVCIIINCNQYVFPFKDNSQGKTTMAKTLKEKPALEKSHVEEERRLFFVAMTRAENELYLLSIAQKVQVSKKEAEEAGDSGKEKKKYSSAIKSKNDVNKFELEISQFVSEADLIK